MKALSLGKRSVAVLAALGLAVGGTVVSAHAAAPAFIDCQLFAAGEPDHNDPALTSTLVGAPSESIFHIDVSPCSITTISVWPSDGLRALRTLNERAHLR